MSMSTHVIGIIPPDDKWQEMKAVWVACKLAKIDPPKVVSDFFNDKHPEGNEGVLIDLTPYHHENREDKGVTRWMDGHRKGFEVVIDRLPPHIKVIRFYNSTTRDE